MLGQRACRALCWGSALAARCVGNAALSRQTWLVLQLRRLTAMFAVAVVLVGCNVTESSRSGGLVPPTGPAPTTATTAAAVVTVAADVSGSRTDGSPSVTHDTLPLEPAPTIGVSVNPLAGGFHKARQVLATAVPLEDFREGVLGVSGTAGSQVWPVIIAESPAARQRGLMGVADFTALGGYAAMVFVFESETSGAFWMRNTPLPLRITFVAADGSVVSGTDMVPCVTPTPADECERYFAAAPYRLAIEHPIGPEFDLGLADAYLVELTIE